MNDKPISGEGLPEYGVTKPKMMGAKQAVATMSEGFLGVMKFLQQEGTPKDILAEAMRIGQHYGLCRRVDGIHPNGQVYMQYVNPYADLVKESPPLALAKPQGNG